MSIIKFKNFPFISAQEKQRAIDIQYQDGYLTGFNCPDHWEEGYRKHGGPGGPWVWSYYGLGRSATEHDIQYSAQSLKENEAWKEGWKAGNKEKHARRADMAKGWDDRGGIGEGSI